MNLEKWAKLSEISQREYILQLYRSGHWFDYEDLALRAAVKLRSKLERNPSVTGVQIDGGEFLVLNDPPINNVRELILNICTLLPENSKLDSLPCSFAGFKVKQLHLGDKRDIFLKTWQRLLKELNGWSETKIKQWSDQWADDLAGKTKSLVYHKGAVHKAVSAILENKIGNPASKSSSRLYSDIRNIIWYSGTNRNEKIDHPDLVTDYDWEKVRQLVAKTITNYLA